MKSNEKTIKEPADIKRREYTVSRDDLLITEICGILKYAVQQVVERSNKQVVQYKTMFYYIKDLKEFIFNL